MGEDYKMDEDKNVKASFVLKYVKSVLESYQKNYWLAAGTLLG
jgi:hypothetical protein